MREGNSAVSSLERGAIQEPSAHFAFTFDFQLGHFTADVGLRNTQLGRSQAKAASAHHLGEDESGVQV